MWMQLCSRAFIAGTNHSLPNVDERQVDSAECVSVVSEEDSRCVTVHGNLPHLELQTKQHNKILKENHILGPVYKPRLRKIYLYGYPLFHNCVSTSDQSKQIRHSHISNQLSIQLTPCAINQLTDLHGLSINVDSEEHLQSEEDPLVDNFLEPDELDLFTMMQHTSPESVESLDSSNNLYAMHIKNACGLFIDHNGCNCGLCLRKKNAIESSVSKAKRLIDDAVLSVRGMPLAVPVPDSCQKNTNFYLVNLAHLLLVIMSLRGML